MSYGFGSNTAAIFFPDLHNNNPKASDKECLEEMNKTREWIKNNFKPDVKLEVKQEVKPEVKLEDLVANSRYVFEFNSGTYIGKFIRMNEETIYTEGYCTGIISTPLCWLKSVKSV